MTFKPTRRLLLVGGLAMVLVIVLAAGAFVLPAYVQSRIIPRLIAGFGLEPAQVQVRRIGLWGADLGPIRLDSQQAGVLTLAAVQVDYSPWSLLGGRLDGITFGGVGLTLEVTPGGVSLAGWRPPARKGAPAPSGKAPDLTTLLPMGLGHVTVSQSRIMIRWNGRSHVIPLEMRLETAELNRGILRGQVRLSIFGNPLTLRAGVDQRANKATLDIAGDHFLLETLCHSGLLPEGVSVSGVLDLKSGVTLQLNPVAVTGLKISGRLDKTRLAVGRNALENTVTTQGESQAMVFSITAEDPDRILLAAGPFRLDGPVRSGATAFKGTFTPGRPNWSLDGRLDTVIPQQAADGGFTWAKELPMSWQIRLGPGPADSVDFIVSSAVRRPWGVDLDPLRMTGDTWDINCHGRLSTQELRAEATWTTGPLQLALPDRGSLQISGVKADGTLSWAMPSNPTSSQANVQAVLSDVQARTGSTVIALPKIQFQSEGRAGPGQDWNLQGRLTLSDGRIQDKARQVGAQGLGLDLPLQWPKVAKARSGRLEVGSLQWQGRRLGGVQGTLQQEGRMLGMRLEHRSKLFKGLRVLINGGLDAGGLRADVRIPAYQPDQGVDLGRFFPAAAGIMAGGRFEARGTMAATKTGLRSRAYLAIDHGFVTQDEHKLKLDGIALTLQIDDIAALKSAPRQRLRVADVQLGDLRAQKLDVDFQLEDRRTLLLEKLGFQWCRGGINAAAVRIVAGKEDYDVTLFCDRLDLAMVLEQLGVAEASGDGTVNGRIPLHWVNGRLSFDNGFLYSTPGQTGEIQMKGAEAQLSRLPAGTLQHTQLDIATEALKDYTYQWAKLNVRSDNDTLLLKLQFDGKPNRLLPFAYNQESGQLIRSSGKGQADFQGIGIDLNFNIPINQILNYKELLRRD
jgi:hypothetical protein